ncbi:hypothetical protein [Bifidobacterium saguinibicoloris]|uniref:hypothetical protein n=1 Tax=Bifidobacterium saguinibicoloris TaxID=2834433 RepID=UPI001C55F2FF|nr:hypothetical protein [Bifidobacterium saguinibicoloris]MBW3080901.1 hypothetical protein [Bifidobacterium saguinibicoloris]
MSENMTRDEMVGANVKRLRGKVSMDRLVDLMCNAGNTWSKTTIFNIEHGRRPLRLSEASDLLKCLGYDPVLDLPKLLNTPAEADLQYAVEQIPQMYKQLIIDFDTLARYRQELAGDATTLQQEGSLNKKLSGQVIDVLKASRLDSLIGALLTTNDHYANQVNDDSVYCRWLRSGLDDNDVEPDELPTYQDVQSMIDEALGNLSGDPEY